MERTPRGTLPGAGSRLRPVVLAGPAGPLEALLQEHEGHAHHHIAVICHPHPLHGGSLNNKVVHRVASVLHGLGATVLRFNFRGVGASVGRFDGGAGELEDAGAALEWMRERHPHARAWLAGFSFGAWIAARLAGSDSSLERLILVAPPVSTEDFSSMRTSRVPKLVFQGTRDELCPMEAIAAEFPGWADPKALIEIDGATHFFDKQLAALAEVLHQALAASV